MSLYCQRFRSMEGISRSSIHQSLSTSTSDDAMARCRSSTMNDPKRGLDLIRCLIQSEINARVHEVIQEFVVRYFEPAFKNMQRNLGSENITHDLIQEACINSLEHVKMSFVYTQLKYRHILKRKCSADITSDIPLKKVYFPGDPQTNLILITKQGQPVRREGDKWNPKRLNSQTLFVSESKAKKSLGLVNNRDNLYVRHPSLFRYCCDSSDKRWLLKNRSVENSEGKLFLMVLKDVQELARDPEYASYPRSELNALKGFKCPGFIVKKMVSFVNAVKTDPSVSDDVLTQQAQIQIAKWNSTNSAYNCGLASNGYLENSLDGESGDDEASLLHDMATANGDVDDDLGFLQGVNLSSLVRELEMEATAPGSQNLAILSIDDDNDNETGFPQLNDTGSQDLSDIDFT